MGRISGRVARAPILPLLLLLALAALVTGAVACSGDSDEVVIGSVLPYTGDLGVYGQPNANAIQLAIDIVNDNGGVNDKQIRLVQRDSATNEQLAVDAANALIDVDGAVAILGGMSSGVTLAVARGATIPKGILQISTASKSPAITTLDDDDLVFRTSTSDELQGGIEARVADSLGYSRIATTYVNNAYGEGLTRVFSREFELLGGEITDQISHESGQASYIAELRRARDSGAEALLVIAYPESAGLLLRESAEGGYFDTYMFVDAVRSDSVFDHAGWSNFEGSYGTAPGAPDSPHERDFEILYEQKFGEPSDDPFAPFAFDAAAILALAIEHADSSDPADIRDSLREVSSPPGAMMGPGELARALERVRDGDPVNYTGAAGDHDFDANGDVLNTIQIWRVGADTIEDTGIFLLPDDPIPDLPR